MLRVKAILIVALATVTFVSSILAFILGIALLFGNSIPLELFVALLIIALVGTISTFFIDRAEEKKFQKEKNKVEIPVN